jgi:ribonuclease E
MAELLILVVIAGVVLLYAVDRTRKLRARARQMSGMNERLDVAAAKVDAQQERKQARVRASAELTSVLPAIRRPPLTLPGVPGSAAEPQDGPAAAEPQDGPAAAEPEAGPAAAAALDDAPAVTAGTPTAADTPAVDDTPAAAEAGNTPDGAGAEETPAAQAAPDSPAAGDNPAAGDSRETVDEVPPEPARTPEGTLTMGRVIPDATLAPEFQVPPDGTLIMPSVPGQGPAPAGEAAVPPPPSRARPRTGQPRASQPRTKQASQPRTKQPSQPRTKQPRTKQQSTSQEQANRD